MDSIQAPSPRFSKEYQTVSDNHLRSNWVSPIKLVPNGSGLCLEIGAGNARRKAKIEGLGYCWIGIDLKSDSTSVLLADAHYLPFRADSFDLVYLESVIEHLQNPYKAIEEASRVLRSGGAICGCASFLEPFHNSYVCFTHRGIQNLLGEAGFTIRVMEPGISVFSLLLYWLFGRQVPALQLPLGKAINWLVEFWFIRLGKAFVFLRHGRASKRYQIFSTRIQEFPFRFAGHILFLAEKVG